MEDTCHQESLMSVLNLTPKSASVNRDAEENAIIPSLNVTPTSSYSLERLCDPDCSQEWPSQPLVFTEDEQQPGEEDNMDVNSRSTWVEAPIQCLLCSYEKHFEKLGKCVKLRNKRKLWEAIKIDLCTHGCSFTVAQIETKIRALERQYKKTGDGVSREEAIEASSQQSSVEGELLTPIPTQETCLETTPRTTQENRFGPSSAGTSRGRNSSTRSIFPEFCEKLIKIEERKMEIWQEELLRTREREDKRLAIESEKLNLLEEWIKLQRQQFEGRRD